MHLESANILGVALRNLLHSVIATPFFTIELWFTPSQVTMLHRAADDAPDQAPSSAGPETQDRPSRLDLADVQEQIARFNERNSWTRRTPWQMIVDAPLLLRRLFSDLRRGDIEVFRELIRRGFQLKILVGVFYVLSPVRAKFGRFHCLLLS